MTQQIDYVGEDGSALRIPVGMPSEQFRRQLAEKLLDAKILHARWAARRIASWIETQRRRERRYGGTGNLLSVEELVEFVRLNEPARSRIVKYAVHPALVNMACELARSLVTRNEQKRSQAANLRIQIQRERGGGLGRQK